MVDDTAAFQRASPAVSIRRLGYDGYVPARGPSEWYPSLFDELNYPANVKMVFRVRKIDPGGVVQSELTQRGLTISRSQDYA